MLYNNFNENLLGLQDVSIEKIEEIDNCIHIYCKLSRKNQKCPHCCATTDKIHDYREQIIKDIPAFGKLIYIHLKKRRYRCSCGKRFQEKNTFLPKYHRMTNRLCAYIISKLADVRSFTDVAKEVNLSVTTVIRVFDLVSYSPQKLPETLSIDEFKGNTNKEKYQCILTDPVNKIVFDILPKRSEFYLSEYFNKFDKSERDNVKVFVSDMWKPYANTANVWFKNSMLVIDKFHWIRQIIWAFEAVRKEEQKKIQ